MPTHWFVMKHTLGLWGVLVSGAVLLACGSGGGKGNSDAGSDGSIDLSNSADGSGGTTSSDTSSDGSSTDGSSTDGSSSGSGGTTGGDSSDGTDGGVLDPLELCNGTCQCSNGIDDDGDGKVDGFDEECTGASDDDEGTFATGISGDNKDPKWQDCFFDGNSGAGDDGCRYHTDCLTGDLSEDDASCTVTQSCIDFCIERTPNGCDCFGCCTFDTADGPLSVQIGLACDYENIDDEESCPRCTPTTQCNNECGECELCPGKEELPESCEEDVPQCDGGRDACDAETPCAPGYWCSLGCCILQAIE